MLAADMGLISGTVFGDATGDGQSPDDDLLADVAIRLFRDGGDGVFGEDDTLVAEQLTDAEGNYTFDRLAAGRYFVQEVVPDGFMTLDGEDVVTVDISAEDAAGVMGLTIDSFDSPQMVMASSATFPTGNSALADPNVLGRERDLFIRLLSGMGVVSLESDFVGMEVLQFSSNGDALGEAEVVWDGTDANATTLDATGLGGLDLTTADDDLISAFLLQAGAEQEGAQVTLTVFTDDANASEALLDIPDTGGLASESFCIRFSDFEVVAGDGADFANVGAIRLTISSGATAVDTQIALTGTVGPTAFEVDFANFGALALGDLVFRDANNDGLFDPESESGIAGVTLNLYEDTDANDTFDPEADALVATTTTDEAGAYLFAELFAGTYFVQVPESQFEPGGPLAGSASSLGDEPAPAPNDDVNNDDNGMPLEGIGVLTGPVTLEAGTEPVDDGDEDANSNLTVDFGFVARIDLVITQIDSPDPVDGGSSLTYTLTVTNNGPAAATGVTLIDALPAGVTFADAQSDRGDEPTETGGVVTAILGDLPVGESATVTIVVDVGRNTFGIITNTATVTATEFETVPEDNTTTEDTEAQLVPASLSGSVFVDFANDGGFDGRDVPIAGVIITLSGTDIMGADVLRTTFTDDDGAYEFTDLLPGLYRIEQTQPIFFPDGQLTVGTAGGVAVDNAFEAIDLMGGIDGEDYNFAELVPRLSKRQFLASSIR